MRVVCSLLTSTLVALSLPGSSMAGVQRTDPDASSPAGVIYEIPLDTARRDGAPSAKAKTSKGSKSQSGTSSSSGSGSGGGGGGGTSGSGGSGGNSTGGGAAAT